MSAKQVLTTIIAIFFILLGSEGLQKPQWQAKIETENGIKVIKNPNEPLYGEITFDLEEDLRIGDDKDKNYLFRI